MSMVMQASLLIRLLVGAVVQCKVVTTVFIELEAESSDLAPRNDGSWMLIKRPAHAQDKQNGKRKERQPNSSRSHSAALIAKAETADSQVGMNDESSKNRPWDDLGAGYMVHSEERHAQDMNSMCPDWVTMCHISAWTRANCMHTCGGGHDDHGDHGHHDEARGVTAVAYTGYHFTGANGFGGFAYPTMTSVGGVGACETYGDAGVGAGHLCHFPFTYNKVVYNSCTMVDHNPAGIFWCATEVDHAHHEVLPKHWGDCAKTCLPNGGMAKGLDPRNNQQALNVAIGGPDMMGPGAMNSPWGILPPKILKGRNSPS